MCKSVVIHIIRDVEEEPIELYEYALISTLQVNDVQSDVLFAEMKV